MDKKIPSHVFSTAKFSNGEKISDIITKYKVRILYLGGNRNGSYFKKDTVDQMCEKMGGVPIIGYYSKDHGDFTSHFGEYIQKVINPETGATCEDYLDTVPYGFIPTDPEVGWEKVTDDDGVEREYLTTTVYLWDGRYPELNVLHEGRPNNLSMELDPETVEGDWISVMNEGIESEYFCFSHADFLGLCILGKDVEPCFEGADFEPLFALEQGNKLKDVLKNMSVELKNALSYSATENDEHEENEPATAVEDTAEQEVEPVVNNELGDDAEDSNVAADATYIEFTPEDVSESKEEFVFAQEADEEEKEPTDEELRAIENSESEGNLDENLDDLDNFEEPEAEHISIDDLLAENQNLKSSLQDLQDKFNLMKEDFDKANSELTLIHARPDKYSYLDGEKNNIDSASYEKFYNDVDKYSLDSLKTAVKLCGYEYLKTLVNRNFSLLEQEPKKEDSSKAIIHNFDTHEDAVDSAPEWVKEVIKAQNKN